MSPRRPTPATSPRSRTFIDLLRTRPLDRQRRPPPSTGHPGLGRPVGRRPSTIGQGLARPRPRRRSAADRRRSAPGPRPSGVAAVAALAAVAPAAAPPGRSVTVRWVYGSRTSSRAVLMAMGELPLVLGAVAGDPARADLAAVAHVLAQHRDVLVVDPLDVVPAQGARLLLDPAAQVLGGPARRGPPPLVVPCHQKGSSSNP